MPVIGISIREIDAKRFEDLASGGVKVDNRTNLREIKEQNIPTLDKKGLNVSFEFKTQYTTENNKKIAEINLLGDVLLIDEKQEQILKDWKKDKKLPDDVNIQIVNTILRKCLTKALTISEELQLPPPLAIPFASKKEEGKEESRYIG
jgi:hypothetical protein